MAESRRPLTFLLSCSALAWLLAGCGPRADLVPTSLTGTVTAREPDCSIDWYGSPDEVKKAFGDLGQIDAAEDKLPFGGCDKESVRDALREQACLAGADAAVILSERKPNAILNCWRIEARIFKYGDGLPPSLPLIHKVAPPLGSTPENLRKYRRETPANAGD